MFVMLIKKKTNDFKPIYWDGLDVESMLLAAKCSYLIQSGKVDEGIELQAKSVKGMNSLPATAIVHMGLFFFSNGSGRFSFNN